MCKGTINYVQYIGYKLQVEYWFQIQQMISVVPGFNPYCYRYITWAEFYWITEFLSLMQAYSLEI